MGEIYPAEDAGIVPQIIMNNAALFGNSNIYGL
jgi:hypothetical protein